MRATAATTTRIRFAGSRRLIIETTGTPASVSAAGARASVRTTTATTAIADPPDQRSILAILAGRTTIAGVTDSSTGAPSSRSATYAEPIPAARKPAGSGASTKHLIDGTRSCAQRRGRPRLRTRSPVHSPSAACANHD